MNHKWTTKYYKCGLPIKWFCENSGTEVVSVGAPSQHRAMVEDNGIGVLTIIEDCGAIISAQILNQ